MSGVGSDIRVLSGFTLADRMLYVEETECRMGGGTVTGSEETVCRGIAGCTAGVNICREQRKGNS